MRCSAVVILGAALFLLQPGLLPSQTQLDTDHDGLSDQLEQSLLEQFVPTLQIGRHECSSVPAEFARDIATLKVNVENGTIYGQAFPVRTPGSTKQLVELHFYHLWKMDCGAHGHPLDAEHVSVLVGESQVRGGTKAWKARYWYAAAHEDTVCDVSQITRASTLQAEDHGTVVWISPGKHASFLNQELCHRGCGRDSCADMQPLATVRIVNLGELEAPMNGSLWTSSPNWPLAAKMAKSDFPAATLGRLEALPDTDIAWFNPGRHPRQGVIAISGSTAEAIGTSGENSFTAISLAADSTGNSLQKSYRKTVNAIGGAGRRVNDALRPRSKPPE